MPESNFFRRIEEKNLSCEVELMQWSPKMDLIALSLSSGEVALHRLSWQKVWTLRAREDVTDAHVTALSWRPDGKILAVGYDSGCVVLVDVEDANIVHENQFKGCGGLDLSHGSNVVSPQTSVDPLSPPPDVGVRCLNWIEASIAADLDFIGDTSSLFKEDDSAAATASAAAAKDTSNASSTENSLLRDDAEKFLQKLPSLAKNQGNLATKKEAPPENVEDSKKIKDQTGLNVLTVGFGRNMIQLFAFGLCPVGNKEIDLTTYDTTFPNQKVAGIIDAYLSQDLQSLTVVTETLCVENSALKSHRVYVYDTSVLVRHHREIRILALRYGQVLALQEYMDATLKLMKEAWEDILQDMDDKLLMFAEEKRKSGGGSLGVDFLELLLYGIASDELNNFLLHNLTAKGLKKLAHSIESSYINIQKLVLKNLQTVCQSLVYHLSDLHGMSKWDDRFGRLGLDKDACLKTLHVAGACFLKACDLQQAIDSSLKNFKAFFSWLYVAIQRLSDEAVPAELGKMSMSDINFVAEFLKENFCYDLEDESKSPATASKGEVKGRFRLERVGQYLKDEPLSFPTPEKNSIWGVFLDHLNAAETSRVLESPLIFPSFASHSILTLNERLLDSFYDALEVPGIKIGSWFSLISTVHLYSPPKSTPFKPLFCHWSDVSNRQYYLAFKNPDGNSLSLLERRSVGCTLSSLSLVSVQFRFLPSDSPSSPYSSPSTSSSPFSLMRISDVQAYDRDSLTLLLQDPKSDGGPFLRQFYIKEVEDYLHSPDSTLVHRELSVVPGTKSILTFNIPNAVASTTTTEGLNAVVNAKESFTTKRLNNLKSEIIAVSGSRKVCCVLFNSKRRVSLFLTDVADEEEEEDEEEETKDGEDEKEEEETEQEVGEGDSTVDEGEEELRMVANLELNVDEGDRESDKENDVV